MTKSALVIMLATLAVGLLAISRVEGLRCWDCAPGAPCTATEMGEIENDCAECLISKGTGNYSDHYSRQCNDFNEFSNKCEFRNGFYKCGCTTNDLCNEKVIEERPVISCYECKGCQAGELIESHIRKGCLSCFTMTLESGDVRHCNSQHKTMSTNCPRVDQHKTSFCPCDTDLCNKADFGVSYEVKSVAKRNGVFEIVSWLLLNGGVLAAMGMARNV